MVIYYVYYIFCVIGLVVTVLKYFTHRLLEKALTYAVS